jgi:hypothetical protein
MEIVSAYGPIGGPGIPFERVEKRARELHAAGTLGAELVRQIFAALVTHRLDSDITLVRIWLTFL